MKLSLGYGKGYINLEIQEENLLEILKPNILENTSISPSIVKDSLENPVGTKKLSQIVKPGDKVAIITSDITRPCPSYNIIPQILEELLTSGVAEKDVVIVFALGSHRKHSIEEKISLVGEDVYKKIRCIDSDENNTVRLGFTKSGTPIDIFKEVADAHIRIGVGNIEYHYFAGYSGGAKALMPGVSTSESIQANHSKMVMDKATAGNLIENPVRDDLEEAISFCSLDFIVNVVLNESKDIVYCVCGHFIEAHRRGCEFLDKMYKKELREKANIVIVSQGGYPKDINLYQTQKALDNAKQAVKEGGIIILVGVCNEGMGNSTFEEWMKDANEPEDLIEEIKSNFKLGGHKAAAIALVLKKARVFLVSEMEEDFVQSIFLKSYQNLQNAYNDALKELGYDSKVLVMPYGGSTLPYVKA